jgi:RecQ family ATP-dependent DNA helicase
VREMVRDHAVRMLYVTPESIMNDTELQAALLHHENTGSGVRRIVVDEAHSMVAWGFDFRLEYGRLGELREMFPKAGVTAATGTATENTKKAIFKMLGMQRDGDVLEPFISSCYRSNLHISMMTKADVTEKKSLHSSGVKMKAAVATQVLDFITAQPEETMYTGIIYCTTIDDVMNVTALLGSEGISAMPYHGRLSKDEKDGALKAWLDETVRVVVATMAFGMGIDKASVRWVLHFSLPRSMENLAQEMGRAGRDQKRSECCMLFSASDKDKIKNTLHKDPASQARMAKCLQDVVRFSINEEQECRHWLLCAYFGDKDGKTALRRHTNGGRGSCGMCDACENSIATALKKVRKRK